jgi:hypothetical protein
VNVRILLGRFQHPIVRDVVSAKAILMPNDLARHLLWDSRQKKLFRRGANMKLQHSLSSVRSAHFPPPAARTLLPTTNPAPRTQREETLVVDDRSAIRPAQMVEDKLLRLLESSLVGVSSLRLSRLVCARRPAEG